MNMIASKYRESDVQAEGLWSDSPIVGGIYRRALCDFELGGCRIKKVCSTRCWLLQESVPAKLCQILLLPSR